MCVCVCGRYFSPSTPIEYLFILMVLWRTVNWIHGYFLNLSIHFGWISLVFGFFFICSLCEFTRCSRLNIYFEYTMRIVWCGSANVSAVHHFVTTTTSTKNEREKSSDLKALLRLIDAVAVTRPAPSENRNNVDASKVKICWQPRQGLLWSRVARTCWNWNCYLSLEIALR